MALGIGFLCMSLTPSLLPRTWLVQGLISGVSTATGYAIGALAARLVPFAPRLRLRRAGWYALLVVGVPLVGTLVWQGTRWQRQLHGLMGAPVPERVGYLRAGLLSCVVFAVLVVLARGLRAAARELGHLISRWLPPRSAHTLSGALVALVALGMLDAVVYDPALDLAVATSQSINDGFNPRVSAPASPARSGGPGSAVSWSSLGLQGRAFVSGGPTLDQLRAFNGAPARPPVRVYVGLHSAPDLRAEAALAVRELVRTGGFARQVLCVITTTGTGWVDPRAAEALEYLYDGDTAQVAIQYSLLPSWLSYLLEKDKAQAAGRELFDQVYAYWSALPAEHRPKLLLFGESLGSFGGEAPFPGIEDLAGRVDGILWAGPLGANRLWSQVVAGRDPGSREVLPSYQQGRTVRFADSTSDLIGLADRWPTPRVVYLQHASDPATWWSPTLLVRPPDWLREPHGRDVLPVMRWYPFVTFWQVSADLVIADHTALGHGHRYGGELAAAWAAIVPPAGWTQLDTQRLADLVDSHG